MDTTITRTIEDDVKSVIEEKLPREIFLKRLMEHFVYVPAASISEDGRHELLLLPGQGDDGMLLPVFTSQERFTSTPFAQNHRPARLPFDALMQKIRPDTNLVVNPYTDAPYAIMWFILQEYVPDFGAEVVRQEVTESWLEEVNQEFTKNETPHRHRAEEAIRIWNEVTSIPISLSSIRARKIREWFRANIKPGSDWVGPIADVPFYHDGAFWEVTIPLCYGRPQINPLDLLRMPASVKLRFCQERNDIFVYLKFWADAFDYYYTVDDVRSTFSNNPLLQGFIEAGREHLTLAAQLLLETRPNPKAAESARTAIEIFLKILLIHRANATEKEVRALGHDLKKLIKRCLETEPSSDLRRIEPKLDLFPDISARYRADEIGSRQLWEIYSTALAAGVIVMRPMSDRNAAAGFKPVEF
jgi:HEPN domain-containing protein